MLTLTRTLHNNFNFSIKEILRDFLQLSLLFVLAIYFVYYAPSLLNKVFFAITLVLFYKSKKDYIWFTFVFLLIMCPGSLFRIISDSNHNIPKIGFGSGLELGYFGFFVLLAFIKALFKKGKKINSLFKHQYKWLLFYFFFLNVISVFYGVNLSLFIVYLKTFLTYTLFYSLPILIPKSKNWFKHALLFSPFVILIFISQLYNIFQGHLMIHFFLGNTEFISETFGRVVDGAVDIRPTGYHDEYVYLVLLMCLILLNVLKNKILRLITVISLVFSIIVVVISASKAPIIVFMFVIFGYFLTQKTGLIKLYKQLVIIIGISAIVIVTVPQISKSFNYTLERFTKLVEFSQGNFQNENRFQNRLPKVLEVAFTNPITGVGFSEKFVSSYPGGGQMGEYHVGTINLIANAGIIGFILFFLFVIRFYQVVKLTKRKSKDKYVKSIFNILLLGFLGIIIINSSSYQLIGYVLSNRQFFFLALFVSFTEVFINELNNKRSISQAK